MSKYQKKPIIIEAHQFDGSSTGVAELSNWINGGRYKHSQIRTRDLGRTLIIKTLEGEMTAQAGDYIIKGIQGEFYPCKPDIFKATYEKVNED